MAAKKKARRKSPKAHAFWVRVCYQIPNRPGPAIYCPRMDERIQSAAGVPIVAAALNDELCYRTLVFRTRRLKTAWDVAHRLLDLWEAYRTHLPLSVRVDRSSV